MERIGIYAGSFDPFTNGHLSILKRASRIFDKVIVAITNNIKKSHQFSLEDRINIILNVIKDENLENCTWKNFSGLLIDFVNQFGDNVTLVRGIRSVTDFDYETQIALANRKLDRNIETIFLLTDHKWIFLSSSLVRELLYFKSETYKMLVPPAVVKVIEGTLEKKIFLINGKDNDG